MRALTTSATLALAAALLLSAASLADLGSEVAQGQQIANSLRSGQRDCTQLSVGELELIGIRDGQLPPKSPVPRGDEPAHGPANGRGRRATHAPGPRGPLRRLSRRFLKRLDGRDGSDDGRLRPRLLRHGAGDDERATATSGPAASAHACTTTTAAS